MDKLARHRLKTSAAFTCGNGWAATHQPNLSLCRIPPALWEGQDMCHPGRGYGQIFTAAVQEGGHLVPTGRTGKLARGASSDSAWNVGLRRARNTTALFTYNTKAEYEAETRSVCAEVAEFSQREGGRWRSRREGRREDAGDVLLGAVPDAAVAASSPQQRHAASEGDAHAGGGPQRPGPSCRAPVARLFLAAISPGGQRWQWRHSRVFWHPPGFQYHAHGLHAPEACNDEPSDGRHTAGSA